MQTPPASCRVRGFSLIEVLVASALATTVGLIGYALLHSGLVLFKENMALNISGAKSRQTLDRMAESVRYAGELPQLVNANGTAATGTSAAGIIVKRFQAGPYLMKESGGTTAEIPATAKTFQLEYTTLETMPKPEVGDFLLVETNGRPQLEIAAVSLSGTQPVGRRRLQITTVQAIGEVVDPSLMRVAAYLRRREGFIVWGTGASRELRFYPRVTTTTNFSSPANYRVMGRGISALGSKPFFKRETVNGTDVISVAMLIHTTGEPDYLDRITGRKGFTSIPLVAKLWTRKL